MNFAPPAPSFVWSARRHQWPTLYSPGNLPLATMTDYQAILNEFDAMAGFAASPSEATDDQVSYHFFISNYRMANSTHSGFFLLDSMLYLSILRNCSHFIRSHKNLWISTRNQDFLIADHFRTSSVILLSIMTIIDNVRL